VSSESKTPTPNSVKADLDASKPSYGPNLIADYVKRLPDDRHTTRICRMIRATTAMEFVTTESETEALILEASLIKRLKPRYNILLRDDKSFPYILVRKDHPAAQVTKHRGARKIKGDYYGPFASAGAVNRTLDTLQRAFRLRNCTDSIYEARTRLRKPQSYAIAYKRLRKF